MTNPNKNIDHAILSSVWLKYNARAAQHRAIIEQQLSAQNQTDFNKKTEEIEHNLHELVKTEMAIRFLGQAYSEYLPRISASPAKLSQARDTRDANSPASDMIKQASRMRSDQAKADPSNAGTSEMYDAPGNPPPMLDPRAGKGKKGKK
ncbi:MAG: hypothetical protein HOB02_08150 [Proteobacteria bacterium]|jgi:hypothetical protein|nr:hypothetical protein [Pseudomonadota bacterium]